MLKHTSTVNAMRHEETDARPGAKITGALTDDAQYVPITSTVPSGIRRMYENAAMNRTLAKCGQSDSPAALPISTERQATGRTKPDIISDLLLLSVALARGIDRRILPAPNQADGANAYALLQYAAMIEG